MKKSILLYLLLALFGAGLSLAQEKKTLGVEDYKQWQRLGSTSISPDGTWVSYKITLNEGNDTLSLVNTTNDSIYKEAFGSPVQFSHDSRFAAWLIGVSKKKKEQMQEKKEMVHYKLALMDLTSGKKTIYKEVSSFSFPEEGPFILLRTYKAKGSTAKGSDVVLMNLNDQSMRTIGNVTISGFNKKGNYFAYITEPSGALGNGVELLDLKTNITHVLASDTSTFSSLVWEKEGKSLAFAHLIKNEDYSEDNFEIVAYRNITKGLKKEVFAQGGHDNFPDKMRVVPRRLQWSEDQSSLFFGITDWNISDKKKKELEKEAAKENEEAEKEAEKAEEGTKDKAKKDADSAKDEKLPGVDIWHWKDDYIQPRQKLTYNADKNFTYLSMWNLDDGRFMQIADSVTKEARLSGDQKYAIVSTMEPYEPQFRLFYSDYYALNLTNGERDLVLKAHTGWFYPSPGGKYIMYFKDKNWWTYSFETKKHVNLTGEMEFPFWDINDDHPAEVRPPFGQGGWLKDDKSLLLYDEYDVWAFNPDGSKAQKLTSGRDSKEIYRVRRLSYENDFLDPKEPIYFMVNGEKTKDSGYARMKWGKEPVTLIYLNKAVGAFTKAKKADKYLFTESTYEQSPVLYLGNADISSKKEIIRSNPQQADFAWGKAELVDFKNKSGKELQGVLHYPANYEPGKKYPMLVYIYEIRSNSLNSYINPSDKSFYNLTNYVQQGYFVFQPDIVYRLDDPGISAVECVVPAVEKVLATGMIDKARIGLMGHSWGAYQTAFIITQTDLFSAAVAGAPLTDMISMYTEVYWNSGSPNQGIFETSQGRFTRPYYEILDKYIENSPMFNAKNITTPFLVAFGNKDGAVDWHQGIELYTTMRRMEKPYVMLVYADENHAVRKKENMLDYTLKINQWFDHFLKGKDAETWITEGVPYLDKMKKVEAKKKK